MLVLDCSVAVKLVVTEDGSDLADTVLAIPLSAPDLLFPECASVLWKKARRAEISAQQARDGGLALTRLGIATTATADLFADALDLSLALTHPAYDMFYLALAQRLDLPLLTADDRLLRRLQQPDVPQELRNRAMPLAVLRK